MNYIDMFIVVLLVWAVFRGYTRGFIMQLTLLAALLIGIYAAIKLSGFTTRQLQGHLGINEEHLYLVSLVITFALAFFGVNLIGKVIEKVAEKMELSFANRMLGVLFSLGKIILLLGVLLSLVDKVDQQVRILPENSREHSLFFKPFTSLAGAIFPALKPAGTGHSEEREFVWSNQSLINRT